jgi:hypothetical protein
LNDIDAFIPSATGSNSRVAACAFSFWKSCPASFRRRVAASTDSQPWIAGRPMFLSGVSRSKRSPSKPWTTLNG